MPPEWSFATASDHRIVVALIKMRHDFLAGHPYPDAAKLALSDTASTLIAETAPYRIVLWRLATGKIGGYAILKWDLWGTMRMLWVEEFYIAPQHRGMPALMGFVKWLKKYLKITDTKQCLFLAWEERKTKTFGRLMGAKPIAALMEVRL